MSRASSRQVKSPLRHHVVAVIAIATALLVATRTPAGPPSTPDPRPQLQRELGAAQARLASLPPHPVTNQLEAVHDVCRLSYHLASLQPEDSERARLALSGIAVAQASLSNNPTSAPTHYYLALNLGELARTKSLGALKIVPRIRNALESARALDPAIDHAGPDRTLGLLYLEAPGWPTSIGSRSQARAHFLGALKIAPDYPGNHLCLAEALLRWREADAARAQLAALDAAWDRARSQLGSPSREHDWTEWTRRRDALRERLAQPARP